MLIFLDVDGVLHAGATAPIGPRLARLPVLEAWLRQWPDVDVVISSTWRLTHTLDQLRDHFSPDLRPRVIDVTPSLRFDPDYAGVPPPCERHLEIERWLYRRSSAPPRSWAALDDWAANFRPGTDRLVLCDPAVGVTDADLRRLEQILGLSGEAVLAEQASMGAEK